jgi:hypothetical protein
MCCFTGLVERVSGTQIFVRRRGANQLVVYRMKYAAASELAMVLPIPIVPGSAEDSVRFVSLERCVEFFKKLDSLFVGRESEYEGMTLGGSVSVRAKLKVHEVGAYEASFVPSPEDFGRLDERFRLPVEIWLELGNYRDWGFAVFKLKPATTPTTVHPMAFEFPTRDPERLFFPTLHVHARRVDRAAQFDHTLYCQPDPQHYWEMVEWTDSDFSVGAGLDCPDALALVDPDLGCWRTSLVGSLENRDTWLGAGAKLPERVKA